MSTTAAGSGPPHPTTEYSFESVFKLWSKYEDIAMHFNDMIIRLRFQALAGVAGLSALVGVFGRDIQDATVRSAVLSGVFALLTLFWVAIWTLDRFYYDKLLNGAVHALLKLEQLTRERPDHLEIDLSTVIERRFHSDVSVQHVGWRKDGRIWFYGIVFGALVGGLVLHVAPLAEWVLDVLQPLQLPAPPP